MRRPSLPIRFSTFGATVGLLVASGLMPDGCAIVEADSLRLRIGVPLWFPLVLFGLGWLLRKRRHRVVLAGLIVGAGLLLTAGVSVVYRGSFDDTGAALMVLAVPLAVLAVALPSAAWAAHHRRGARSRSTGPILAVAAAAIAALYWGLDDRQLDLRLAFAGLAGCVALAIVAGRDVTAPLSEDEVADGRVKIRRARRVGLALVVLALVVTGLATAVAVVPDRPPPRAPGSGGGHFFLGGC